MKRFLPLLCLMASGCTRWLPLYNLAVKQPLNPSRSLIIIMAGQSNMTGGYNEDKITPNSSRIRYINPAGSGPVVPFANALTAKNPNLNLIIVSCAKSGTFLSQWAPGGFIEACIKDAKDQEANGVIGGFIFLQGEADSKYVAGYTTDNWAETFTSLARYVRTSLNPSTPIVLGRINKVTIPGFPLWDHIRAEQDSVNLPALTHVSTDGAGLVDGIHYDQAGYLMVGQRMADAFYGLLTDGQ